MEQKDERLLTTISALYYKKLSRLPDATKGLARRHDRSPA
jgi:hypothetical protein